MYEIFRALLLMVAGFFIGIFVGFMLVYAIFLFGVFFIMVFQLDAAENIVLNPWAWEGDGIGAFVALSAIGSLLGSVIAISYNKRRYSIMKENLQKKLERLDDMLVGVKEDTEDQPSRPSTQTITGRASKTPKFHI